MTVQCLTCSRSNLRDAGAMARLGYGLCKVRPRWEFFGADTARECEGHAPASEEIVASRREWLAKLEAKGRT